MSAYIVDRNHIVYLVSAAGSLARHGARWFHNNTWHELRAGNAARAAEVGNMLWAENIKSVSHRYPNESTESLPGPVNEKFVITPKDFSRGHWDKFDPVQVLQSCACYNYQSCEHDDFKESEAYAFIKSLKGDAINSLPGYANAVWGAPEPSSKTSICLSML